MRFSTNTRKGNKHNTVFIEGDFRGRPPVTFGLILTAIPIFVTIAMLSNTWEKILDGSVGAIVSMLLTSCFCILFVGVGLWITRESMVIRKAVTRSEAAAQLGMSETQFTEVLHSEGIEPDYDVNGEPMYHLDSLEMLSLLRPASEGTQYSDVLVRAVHQDANTASELLRATTDLHDHTHTHATHQIDSSVSHDFNMPVSDNSAILDVGSWMTDSSATIDVSSSMTDSSSSIDAGSYN